PFITFLFHTTPPTQIYTLSLHDALPISDLGHVSSPTRASAASALSTRSSAGLPSGRNPSHVVHPSWPASPSMTTGTSSAASESRSEEHTSELQSPCNLVCRLLLEKKK